MTDEWPAVGATPPRWLQLAELFVLVALLPVLLPLFLVQDLLRAYRVRKLKRGAEHDDDATGGHQ